MNKKTREKIEKKAAETVKARHTKPEAKAEAKVPTETAVAKAAEIKEANAALPKLPKLPRSRGERKAKPLVDCACGCGCQTRATWFPGHDARAKGWALRISRDICTMADVPVNERKGAQFMLDRLNESAGAAPIKLAARKPKAEAVGE